MLGQAVLGPKQRTEDRVGTVTERYSTDRGTATEKRFPVQVSGSEFCADGDALVPVEARMEKAAVKFSMLCQILKSSESSVALKPRLYAASVVSVLSYGYEAWK